MGIVLLAYLTVSVTGSACSAQDRRGREGKFEIAVLGNWVFDGASVETDEWEYHVEEDEGFLYGAHLGWNATDHWNFNTNFAYGSLDIAGSEFWWLEWNSSWSGYVARGEQDIFIWTVNAEYNILAGPLTPFVTAGFGVQRAEGDVRVDYPYAPDFYPGSGDDRSLQPTGVVWTLGAGGRWDITDQVFVKFYYRITGDPVGGANRDMITFGVGWMF